MNGFPIALIPAENLVPAADYIAWWKCLQSSGNTILDHHTNNWSSPGTLASPAVGSGNTGPWANAGWASTINAANGGWTLSAPSIPFDTASKQTLIQSVRVLIPALPASGNQYLFGCASTLANSGWRVSVASTGVLQLNTVDATGAVQNTSLGTAIAGTETTLSFVVDGSRQMLYGAQDGVLVDSGTAMANGDISTGANFWIGDPGNTARMAVQVRDFHTIVKAGAAPGNLNELMAYFSATPFSPATDAMLA